MNRPGSVGSVVVARRGWTLVVVAVLATLVVWYCYSRWPEVTKDAGPIAVGLFAVFFSGLIALWTLDEQRSMAREQLEAQRAMAGAELDAQRALAAQQAAAQREADELERLWMRRAETYYAVMDAFNGSADEVKNIDLALGGRIRASASESVIGALTDYWAADQHAFAPLDDVGEIIPVKKARYTAVQVMAKELLEGEEAAAELWTDLKAREAPFYERERLTPTWSRGLD